MFARTLGVAIVGLVVCVLGLQAGGGGKDAKDAPAKDKKVEPKKVEVPKDAIAGKVKAVDVKGAKFTITLKDGKDRTFGVDEKTEFYGPLGGDRGTGVKGLEDDTMAKDYEIKVVAAKDGKTAKDVHLPNRKTTKKVEKDKK